jgi:hypothetical protein
MLAGLATAAAAVMAITALAAGRAVPGGRAHPDGPPGSHASLTAWTVTGAVAPSGSLRGSWPPSG